MPLHSDLDQISRVCHRDSNGTSCHTCGNFLQHCRVLAWLHRPANQVSNGNVKTDSEACKDKLSLQAWRKTAKKRAWTLLRGNHLHSAEHAIVLRCDAWLRFLYLQSNLGSVNWNSCRLTDHSSCRSHQHVSAEEGQITLSFHSLSVHLQILLSFNF